jgi:AcrR family transcriptional regulator
VDNDRYHDGSMTDAAISDAHRRQVHRPAPGLTDDAARSAEAPAADDTVSRLVAAAAAVFAEKGYDGAGVAEIARRAGLTTGAIYSRFTGKAELLASVIATHTGDEFDTLFAEHGFQGRAQDLLNTVGSHLVTREPTPAQALLLEAFVAARRDEEVARILREHLESRAGRLAAMIDAGKQAGVVDPALDTAAIVHFAHAVGLGFLLFEAVGTPRPRPGPWEEIVGRVVAAMDPRPAELPD